VRAAAVKVLVSRPVRFVYHQSSSLEQFELHVPVINGTDAKLVGRLRMGLSPAPFSCHRF
jgi:hypothetical protein